MTSALLSAMPPPPTRAKVLDFCAGSGVIAAALLAAEPTLRLHLLDADALAVRAARGNVGGGARVYLGDGWDGLPRGTRFDLIVSNCVVNLSPDKRAVLKEAYRVLKTGGELYFSDVYSSRRVPAELVADPVLWGECLSGALYWNDFLALAKQCGFGDPRLVKDSVITVANEELEKKLEHIKFFSATYRLFKLPGILEPDCEDYGQAVIYKGTIPQNPHGWALDDHHYMQTGKVFPVCGNTYHMLHDTRFMKHFDFIGDKSTHYGIFEGCGKSIPYASAAEGGKRAAPVAKRKISGRGLFS
jgi:SAM-dependent methyltransferase